MKCMEPATAGKLRLRNRIAVAAMSRMQAEQDGTVSRDMAGYYARYARHGAGLVFTEALYTDITSARAYFRQPGLATDAQAEGWSGIVQGVHAHGAIFFAQLQHGGRLCEPGLNPLHLAASDGTAAGNTWQTATPNAAASAATPAQIDAIVQGFVQAARRAVAAGFDGIELHGARGYLLDDFLSATSNRRTDNYGGSLQGRLALPLRVIREVRAAIGDVQLSYNLSIYKMDDNTYQPPGGKEEAGEIARALAGAGADILHVTTRKLLRPEPWGETLARTVRDAVPGAIVIGNGGIKTLTDADEALASTGVDLVSIARPFLANPDWIEKMQRGRAAEPYVPGMERLPLLSG